MKIFKRCLCLILVMSMLLGTLPASAQSDLNLQQRLENNRERYNNFIALDPQLFLYPNHIRDAFAMLDDEQYEYVRDLTFEITKDCKTADEEIFAAAEYIATNVCYGDDDTTGGYSSNPYHILRGTPTLCGGYEETFLFMMQVLGHPCASVTSQDHAWNLVYNGSRWMAVDVTWCSGGDVIDGVPVKDETMYTAWYDFPLEWTNEEPKHYIDLLPYSKVGDLFESFPEYADVTSFTIPGDVTRIAGMAFDYCKFLTSVELHDSITMIGNNAFDYCISLRSINIPDSVTSIGKNAFRSCYSLTSIDLSDSITEIADYTFEGAGLTEITIPGSVKTIGTGAFEDTDLKSVTIPKSVTEIGDYAFLRCNDLADVYYEGTEADWKKITIGEGNHSLTNAIIYFGTDEGSKEDAGMNGEFGKNLAWSFAASSGTLTVSGSGEMPAYHYGTGVNPPWYDWLERVESIVIKSGVSYVSKAFEYADNLKEVEIEEGVETIAWCAFYYCPALETVTLPRSIKSIEFDAFYGCDNLKTVYYQGSEEEWNAIAWPTMEGDGEPHFLPSTRVVFLGTDDGVEEDPCAAGHKYTVRETDDSVIYTCSVCADQYTEKKPSAVTDEAVRNFEKTGVYTDGMFGDIKSGDWFCDNVRTVYEYGLMNGTGAGGFSPSGEITIAEAVTMAARLHNIYHSKAAAFAKAEGEAWYAPYVAFAKEVGILTEPLHYEKVATREEFVYLLSRSLPEEVLPDIRGAIAFADAQEIGRNDAVELLVRAGVINGIEENGSLCFLPQKTITRAEGAAVMSRMILPALRSAS